MSKYFRQSVYISTEKQRKNEGRREHLTGYIDRKCSDSMKERPRANWCRDYINAGRGSNRLIRRLIWTRLPEKIRFKDRTRLAASNESFNGGSVLSSTFYYSPVCRSCAAPKCQLRNRGLERALSVLATRQEVRLLVWDSFNPGSRISCNWLEERRSQRLNGDANRHSRKNRSRVYHSLIAI